MRKIKRLIIFLQIYLYQKVKSLFFQVSEGFKSGAYKTQAKIFLKAFFSKQRRFQNFVNVSFFIFALAFAYSLYIFLSLPSISKIADFQPKQMSQVFDRNGKLIGKFFLERRQLVPFSDFPEHLVHAIVAAEDGSFFKHKGLNYKAIFRALIANLKAGRKVQGGSTITQQLTRALLLSSKKTYTRKIKEAILALKFENQLSKQDILYLYLNQIYFGHGAYGVETASQVYFRKNVKDVTLAEAALIAGLPQAPSAFSPIFFPQKAKERQIYVLNRMAEEKHITSEQKMEALKEVIKVYFRKDHKDKAPYFLETLRQILIGHVGEKALLTGGLKIYSSLDIEHQSLAQEALREGLRDLDKRQGYQGPFEKFKNTSRN